MDFYEKYKALSNLELFRILDNPEKYQEQAITAATKIKNERALDASTVAEIQGLLNAEKERKHSTQLKKEAFKGAIENKIVGFFEKLNPVQIVTGSVEHQINSFCFFLGVLFLYQFFKDYRLLYFILTEKDISLSEVLIYGIPLLYLPISGYFFYQRKKIGWQLLTIFFAHSLLLQIYTCFMFWEYIFGNRRGTILVAGFSTILLLTLFFAGVLYFLCQKKIRNRYTITPKTAVLSIALGCIITSILVATY